MVTNDTRIGAKLTTINALSYTWESENAAEEDRVMYQSILGVQLAVRPLEKNSGILI